MPHIVTPLRSNLPIQMLLEGNLYVALTWGISYALHTLYWGTNKLSVYVLFAVLAELLRVYTCTSVNLRVRGSRPRKLFVLMLAGCLPLLYTICQLNDLHIWLQCLCHLWAVFVALELIVSLGLLWSKHADTDAMPNWSILEGNLRKRRRQHCPPSRLYKL